MSSEKFDPNYEKQIIQLAENRINTGNYKVFDARARVVTRRDFPGLVQSGQTGDERCLVIVNSAGETIVITREFELALKAAIAGGK